MGKNIFFLFPCIPIRMIINERDMKQAGNYLFACTVSIFELTKGGEIVGIQQLYYSTEFTNDLQ